MMKRNEQERNIKPAVIELSESDILDCQPSEEDSDEFLFSITKDMKTGWVKICPMNSENCITIHGVKEARWFIAHLLNCIQTE